MARHLFDRLIGPAGLLREKTRVLVTHNLAFLARVDRVLVLQEGRLVEQGTLQQLRERQTSAFQEFAAFITHTDEAEAEAETELEPEEAKTEEQTEVRQEEPGDKEKGKLTKAETSAEGRVSWRHYRFYLNSLNISLFVLVIALFLAAEAFKVGGNLVLAQWTENFSRESNGSYIGYYCLLALACSITGQFQCQSINISHFSFPRHDESDGLSVQSCRGLPYHPPLSAGEDDARPDVFL